MAGVSITTVSKVINGKDSDISEATIQRVMEVIEEYNYRPNALARGLVTRQTKTIGLIIPDISNPFFASTSRGIEDMAKKGGYTVIFCDTDDEKDKEEEALNVLKEKQVDGIIYTPTSQTRSHDIVKRCTKSSIPIVVLDRVLKNDRIYMVYLDNMLGGFLATQYLLKKGHRRIGCITGPCNVHNSHDRFHGYQRALLEAEIEIDQDLIFEGNYRLDSGFKGACKLIDKGVTAIFACNDMMAYGVYKAATSRGLKIPDQLSISGFDDIYTSEILQPSLTSVKQPAYEMGVAASDILIHLLEGKKVRDRQRVFEPILIPRESVMELGR